MKFAQMQMAISHPFAEYTYRVWANDVDTGFYFPNLGINSDAMGLCWFIDRGINIIWHGGTVDTFETFAGFDKDEDMAVVVLSNIRSRIPSWVIGLQIFKELR